MVVAALALFALLLPQAVLSPASPARDAAIAAHPHYPPALADSKHEHGSGGASEADHFRFCTFAAPALPTPSCVPLWLLEPARNGRFVPVSSHVRPQDEWLASRFVRGPPLLSV
jgi:hypothetical protein